MATYSFDDAVAAAATELSLPSTHRRVGLLATLEFAFLSARQRWASAQTADSQSAMFTALDRVEAFRKEAALLEPVQINVHYVEGVTGIYKCRHCGQQNELEHGSYTPIPDRPAPAPAPDPKPAPVAAKADNVVSLTRSDVGGASWMGGVSAPRTDGSSYSPFGSEFHRGGI